MEFYLVALACLVALAMAGSVRAGYLAGKRSRIAAGRVGEDRVGTALDMSGGHDRLDDLVLGRSFARSAQIDHLVRGRDCLLVVETKNWSGIVSGGESDAEWTLSRRQGKPGLRRNPLWQAARQARLVREFVGVDSPAVHHVVVMAGRASPSMEQFAAGVVALRDLGSTLPALLQADPGCEPLCSPEHMEAVWTRLVEHAYAPATERRSAQYMDWLEQRFGEKPWRSWLVVAFSLAALAWTMALCITAIRMRGDGTLI